MNYIEVDVKGWHVGCCIIYILNAAGDNKPNRNGGIDPKQKRNAAMEQNGGIDPKQKRNAAMEQNGGIDPKQKRNAAMEQCPHKLNAAGDRKRSPKVTHVLAQDADPGMFMRNQCHAKTDECETHVTQKPTNAKPISRNNR